MERFVCILLLTLVGLCRFTGTAGTAIVSKTSAYLVTDSRYWLQAQEELDGNWILIQAGSQDGPKDWVEWLSDRVNESRVGIDARMISHEKATTLNNAIAPKKTKLVYPLQNLVDLLWVEKPSRPKEPIFVQPLKYAGLEASAKLQRVRQWIKEQIAMITPAAQQVLPQESREWFQTHLHALMSPCPLREDERQRHHSEAPEPEHPFNPESRVHQLCSTKSEI